MEVLTVSIWLRKGPQAFCSGHGKEPSVFMQVTKFPNLLSILELLTNVSAPRS